MGEGEEGGRGGGERRENPTNSVYVQAELLSLSHPLRFPPIPTKIHVTILVSRTPQGDSRLYFAPWLSILLSQGRKSERTAVEMSVK